MLNSTIVKKIQVSKGLVILGVRPDDPIPDFIPGQYATLGVYGAAPRPDYFPPEVVAISPDKLIKRPYSIASSPLYKDHIEFYLAILPEGEFTSRLELMNEGDRIYMAPKCKGTFTLNQVPHGCNLIFVSTGTGLAPYISMLRTEEIWQKYKNITLIHGVRYAGDFAYSEELIAISKNRPLRYEMIVSRPDESWSGPKGYVQDLIKHSVLSPNPECDQVMLCGNPAMIKDMSDLLLSLNFKEHTKREPGNLHIEKYW